MRLEGFYMIVYIEYVLIDNFFIDYLLLKTTFTITGNGIKKGRQIIAAMFGAGISLLFPILNLNFILTGILKICVGIVIVAVSNKFLTAKNFYINCVIFILLTFTLGGIVLGMSYIFGINISTEFSIAIMLLPVYLLIKTIIEVVNYLFSRKRINNFSFDCKLVFNNKEINCKGFLDTGNSLYYNKKPVIVIDKNYFIKEFDEKILFSSFITFEYWTSAGLTKMPLFKLKSITIKSENKEYIFNDFYMGVGNVPDKILLLHPNLMEESYEQNSIKTEEDNRKILAK